jgi:cytidine deaminase
MTDRELINTAREAMKMAYVPYSGFAVGAAIECEDGTVITGCNVENVAFGATICAEQSAIAGAVSSGHRRFRRIAIAANSKSYCYPCGTCRQILMEFAPNIEVLSVRMDGRYVSYRLSALLPQPFVNDMD